MRRITLVGFALSLWLIASACADNRARELNLLEFSETEQFATGAAQSEMLTAVAQASTATSEVARTTEARTNLSLTPPLPTGEPATAAPTPNTTATALMDMLFSAATNRVATMAAPMTTQTLAPVSYTPTASATRTPQPPTATNTKTAVPETMYAVSNANVRSCPRTSCEALGALVIGQRVNVLERVTGDVVNAGNDTWFAIDYQGDAGYVYSALLSRQQPQAAPAQPQLVPQQPQVQPTSPPQVQPDVLISTPLPTQPPAPAFSCNCDKTCGQMASCEEAYYQLQTCGCGQRDGDGDGVPCEDICPGG